MQVMRSAAINMFKELGYKTCDKWEEDRIERKLNKLPELVDGTPDVPDSIKNDPNHLCNVIRKAVKDNEKIELVLEEGEKKMKKKEKDKKRGRVLSVAEYEGREEPKKAKKENSAKGKERPAGKKSEKKGTEPGQKKEKAGVDAYGFRADSNKAKVNAMLSSKPITMKEIKEKMGGTFYEHLNELVNRGIVTKTDDGWVLAKKAK